MILKGKTVIVTGVGVGLGRECAASRSATARTSSWRPDRGGARGPRRRARSRRRAHRAPGHRHHRCRRLCGARAAGAGAVRVGRRAHPGGGVRARLGRAATTPTSTTGAQAFETNVLGALTLLRPVADGHEGGRRRLGRAHRLAVDVQAVAAAGRLRRVEGRAADGDVLPRRRARPGQHPLQHGRPVVDVGTARRDVRRRARRSRSGSRARRSSRRSSATSRSAA